MLWEHLSTGHPPLTPHHRIVYICTMRSIIHSTTSLTIRACRMGEACTATMMTISATGTGGAGSDGKMD